MIERKTYTEADLIQLVASLRARVAELERERDEARKEAPFHIMYDRRLGYVHVFGCPECGAKGDRMGDSEGCCRTCGADLMHDESGELLPCPLWDDMEGSDV